MYALLRKYPLLERGVLQSIVFIVSHWITALCNKQDFLYVQISRNNSINAPWHVQIGFLESQLNWMPRKSLICTAYPCHKYLAHILFCNLERCAFVQIDTTWDNIILVYLEFMMMIYPKHNISEYERLSEICEFISVVVRHIDIYFLNYCVHIRDPGLN